MARKFRVVFMGTPEFAVASLDAIIKAGHEVCAVVTSADKPAGRGQKIQYSAVKEYALKHGLKILQPINLKSEDFINELKSLQHDIQVVVAFRMLPEMVWNLPPLGTYNVHASLLPKYRGAAPINWCIINGDKETGVTTFKLTHQIDTGQVLLQEKIAIGDEMTAGELHDNLMVLGAKLIVQTLNLIGDAEENGKEIPLLIQNEQQVSHAPKIFKDTCRINWNKTAGEVHNLIRGLSPYPAAFSELKTNDATISIKFFKVKILPLSGGKVEAGRILTDNKSYIHVVCKDALIDVEELQIQGKKRMSVKDMLNGFQFSKDSGFI